MKEPAWITRMMADAIHSDLVAQHGGLLGVRDENGLESALARPRHLWARAPRTTIVELASAYAYGITRNHPYNDGSKRTAFMLAYVFLGTNGRHLDAAEEEVVSTLVLLAEHRLSEAEFAEWLKSHTRRG